MALVYVIVAIVVAAGSFAFTDWMCQRRGWECDRPGLFAAIAGLAWPVLLIGILQFFVIAAVVKFAFARRRPAMGPDAFSAARG